jgi:hypothetical protein
MWYAVHTQKAAKIEHGLIDYEFLSEPRAEHYGSLVF